jgi:hypothetical protein
MGGARWALLITDAARDRKVLVLDQWLDTSWPASFSWMLALVA